MFEFIGNMIWLVIAGVASIGGYVTIKRFVRERLRFVDGVHRRGIPLVAGLAAGILASPAAILPFINPFHRRPVRHRHRDRRRGGAARHQAPPEPLTGGIADRSVRHRS